MPENENYIGVAMGLDVSDLKSGLAEASKRIGTANADFRAASSEMENWQQSIDGVRAKVNQLDTVLQAQRSKLAGLTAEYQRVVEAQGENSTAARNLYIRMQNQQAVVNQTEREFNNYTETLRQAESGTIDLTDVTLRNGRALTDLGDDAQDAGDGFTIAKGAIAGFIANGLNALVSATKNAISSLIGLADSTTEYTQGLHRLETAFGQVGMSAEETYSAFNYFGSVLGDTRKAEETMLLLGQIASTEKELVSWTDTLTGVYATYGEAIPLEGLTEAVNHTSQLGEVQGTLADALEWGGITVDDFNAQLSSLNTKEERAAHIQNTLNGLYGEAADTYNELNKDILDASTASTNLQNSQAKLGDVIRPLLTTYREGVAKLIDSLLELTKDIDFESVGKRISEAFDSFINDVMPKIIAGIKWLMDNSQAVITGIVGIGSAFLAWKVVGIIQSVTQALKGMSIAQAVLNAVMKANPIGLIVTGITLLITSLVILYQKNEWFKNAVDKIWAGIKDIFAGAWNYIKGIWDQVQPYFAQLWEAIKRVFAVAKEVLGLYFKNAWEGIKLIWSNAVAYFKMIWENIKLVFSVVKSVLTGDFRGAWEGIKGIFSNVKGFFSQVLQNILGAFSNIKENFLNVGDNIIKGIWDGISGGAKWLKDKISGFAGNVADWFKDTFKIHSPSKLMADEVGLYVGEGIGVGVLDSIPSVKKQLSTFSDFVTDSLGGIKTGLSLDTGNLNTIRNGGNGSTVINSPVNVTYNGSLSRKQIKQLENDNYNSIKLKLKAEGAIK